MHLEFRPADAPDPADRDVRFSVPAEQITTELLEICDEFLRRASPIVHTELGQFLNEHGLSAAVSAGSSMPSDSSRVSVARAQITNVWAQNRVRHGCDETATRPR